MESATLAMRSSSSTFFSKSFIFNNNNNNPSVKLGFKCIQISNMVSDSLANSKLNSRIALRKIPSFPSCSAVTSLTSSSYVSTDSSKTKLHLLITEFQSIHEPIDRVKHLLNYASSCPSMDETLKTLENRVPGCTAQVWLRVTMDEEGRVWISADSDSDITKGFCACLISVLNGTTAEEVLELKTEDFGVLNVLGINGRGGFLPSTPSRANTWHNVLVSIQKRTKALVAEREGKPPGESFPSLIITADGIQAKGSYAEAQAMFLSPDESRVKELSNLLKEKKIGVVAHFYMDPEVQGVLTAAQKLWPHIHISDSLVMADSAVKMAEEGCKFITVLGVDFMSENVRAILDQAGYADVGVYRMSNERIGCSLADAANAPAYTEYLGKASLTSPSLHVVYINTSLETKAISHELVPTITCTSSNVVQTILQAFSEVPNLNLWYGPDSYMGANIAELFRQMTAMTDEEIAEIHPKHNRNTMKSLLSHFHYFQEGTCIVHHMFGHEVVEKINEMYCDAYLTAHFEVPGEMFSMAMEAKKRDMGVVGSTQNILDFIKKKVQEAMDRNVDDHLQFVLGTESGMVTSIVAAVKKQLGSLESSSSSSQGRGKVSVEIVFPVSSESVSKTPANSSMNLSSGETGEESMNVAIIPGVTSGEGCSIHGGCASCPYMKMNSLSALLKICRSLSSEKTNNNFLSEYEAGRFSIKTPSGKLIAEVGCEPILYMRHFQATKRLSEKLIEQVMQSKN